MNGAEKVLTLVGAVFAGIGTVITVIFFGMAKVVGAGFGVFVALPLFFVVMGLCFVIAPVISKKKRAKIIKNGTKYPAKIYGYAKNASYVVNGVHPTDTKVHYFDNNGVEREVVLPTRCAGSDGLMPVGMTVDIYEYKGKFSWDASSVRSEVLYREAELMDNKPIEPEKQNIVAVKCKNCGATFEAIKGFTGQCPYCGGYTNA